MADLSNVEKEMLWIDTWEELWNVTGRPCTVPILDDQGRQITQKECEGLIQDKAYESLRAEFHPTFFKGRSAMQVLFKPA